MKKFATKIAFLCIVLFSVSSAFGSTPNPNDQFDWIRGGIPAKVEVTRQEIKAMDTSIDQLLRRTGGLLKKDVELQKELEDIKKELEDIKGKLDKVVKPGDLTIIRVDMGKLWAQVNNHEQRLTDLEENDQRQDGDILDIKEELKVVNDRLDRGLGVKLGIATYAIYGTSGSISGGASLSLVIPASESWEVVITGGAGGTHEGASGFADVAIRHVVSDSLSVGVAFGIDANCDGLCTRLLTEIWGAGPDMEFRFADGWFLRGRILLGSEWQKMPTTATPDEDGNMVYQTNDSRDFGVSGFVGIGHEF